MARRALSIVLDSGERAALEAIVRSPASAQRDVVRARIVLLAASGLRNDQIREKLGVSKPVVVKWRRRFYDSRMDGLADKSGRGRKRTHDAVVRQRIAAAAYSEPPASVGAYWSVRTLAKELGVSASLVQSVLRAESVRSHRSRYWKRSEDPEFEPKMLAIIGLYLHLPERAVVLSVGEKASIRALERTQPQVSVKPHRIERVSQEYKRDDTPSLLAAL
ncbi:MAG: helix-turn-helix domain-containing protein [Bryobacterales bacterium]|nr:helix-turn-helix domain-containing protein [Bryobacterales bacterium]